MNNENQELLKEVKIAVFNLINELGDSEDTTKLLVKAITEGIEVALGYEELVDAVLKDMSYWAQPWINPYYDEDEQ